MFFAFAAHEMKNKSIEQLFHPEKPGPVNITTLRSYWLMQYDFTIRYIAGKFLRIAVHPVCIPCSFIIPPTA